MKNINRYQYTYLLSDGTGTRECRASSRSEAAIRLRCPVTEVEYLETVKPTASERRVAHMMRMPALSLVNMDSVKDDTFRPRRQKRPGGKPEARAV